MRALAVIVAAILVAGCSTVQRETGDGEQRARRPTHVTLVLCLFSNCRQIGRPPDETEPTD